MFSFENLKIQDGIGQRSKQQISKFYLQIQWTDTSNHIYVSQWPVINVKARRN